MSVKRLLPAALILLSIGGLATENLSHYPVGLMSLLGVYHLWRHPRATLQTTDARLLTGVFACVWIPMLLSLPDAANPARAFKTAILYLHFLPAGLYVARSVADPQTARIVLVGLAGIVAFWCFDGVVQLMFGRDLFGYPYDGSVLKGVFYPKQRFGLILAVFTPFYLHIVRCLALRTNWAWALLLPFIVAVVFSLKRTAWIMLVVALAVFAASFFRSWRTNVRATVIAFVLIAATSIATVTLIPNVRMQVQNTLQIFAVEFETADRATSYRLSLWRTGLSIVREHWINGVGPRGFRTVYRDYAGPDDFWIARGSTGQTHPHLMILEVLIETGAIGLLGYVLAQFLLLRGLWRRRLDDPDATVYLMIVLVAWFPLNAHLAFYGSYWSTIAWVLLGLGCVRRERYA